MLYNYTLLALVSAANGRYIFLRRSHNVHTRFNFIKPTWVFNEFQSTRKFFRLQFNTAHIFQRIHIQWVLGQLKSRNSHDFQAAFNEFCPISFRIIVHHISSRKNNIWLFVETCGLKFAHCSKSTDFCRICILPTTLAESWPHIITVSEFLFSLSRSFVCATSHLYHLSFFYLQWRK